MKLIKSIEDYKQALERLDYLLSIETTQNESDELEVLLLLIETYEDEQFPIDLPNPIEAIKFKMEQHGLKQKDLVTYIGSKSKVSEVLNGKRPLTLSMMRALHTHLGIPAEVLLQEPNVEFPTELSSIDFQKFPLLELFKRGVTQIKEYREYAEEIIRDLYDKASRPFSQTSCFRAGCTQQNIENSYALFAWELLVRIKAKEIVLENKYSKDDFVAEHLKRLKTFSILEDGPLKAKEYLEKHGIILVIEESFKKAHVDGVALLLDDGTPVIGLSLRYDRVDYFWFTLFHELGHLIRHLSKDESCILDAEIDVSDTEKKELEANEFASETLISQEEWQQSKISGMGTTHSIKKFARKIDIHPAIIAGQLRKIHKNFNRHTSLLGNGTIRQLFKI